MKNSQNTNTTTNNRLSDENFVKLIETAKAAILADESQPNEVLAKVLRKETKVSFGAAAGAVKAARSKIAKDRDFALWKEGAFQVALEAVRLEPSRDFESRPLFHEGRKVFIPLIAAARRRLAEERARDAIRRQKAQAAKSGGAGVGVPRTGKTAKQREKLRVAS